MTYQLIKHVSATGFPLRDIFSCGKFELTDADALAVVRWFEDPRRDLAFYRNHLNWVDLPSGTRPVARSVENNAVVFKSLHTVIHEAKALTSPSGRFFISHDAKLLDKDEFYSFAVRADTQFEYGPLKDSDPTVFRTDRIPPSERV